MTHPEKTSKQQGHACGCRQSMGQQMAASGHRGESSPRGSALDILDVRFARGEIERAEYEEKKQLISQRPAGGKLGVLEAGRSKAAANASPSAAKSNLRQR